MDIVEFVEEIWGRGSLPLWQRELLQKHLAMIPMINDDNIPNNKPEITHEHSRGLAAKFTTIDENAGYFFDPTIMFDKDGGIRITEISLMRKP